MAGTLYLCHDHFHIVAGRYHAQHPRFIARGDGGAPARANVPPQLAAVSGTRGRRYLQREHPF